MPTYYSSDLGAQNFTVTPYVKGLNSFTFVTQLHSNFVSEIFAAEVLLQNEETFTHLSNTDSQIEANLSFKTNCRKPIILFSLCTQLLPFSKDFQLAGKNSSSVVLLLVIPVSHQPPELIFSSQPSTFSATGPDICNVMLSFRVLKPQSGES